MTLVEMVDRLRKESSTEMLNTQHRTWAGRMAVALAEIDRRLTILEAANGAGSTPQSGSERV